MGGGAAMRSAAKVAGVGVVNNGIRGGFSSFTPPAEQSVRSASRPASAFLSSSQNGKAGVVDIEGVQRPAWELDDWEFAGLEEEHLLESREPMPRVVFGPVPSLQEAKEATSDLKDALEKAYLSGSSSLTNSEPTDTETCMTFEPRATIAPKYAVKAFALLNESPQTQTIVASIASDPTVWDAVFKNEALQEFLQSQKTNEDLQNLESPKEFTELSDVASEVGSSENSPMDDILVKIKLSVVEMMNNVSNFVQNIFGFSGENNAAADEKTSQQSFFNNAMGASILGLAVMVIMMVVMKRA
ncbi:uncharacterized protein [Euphorbia lathyris]|uniref:uncharacterized protein n=1 Tax=Euphorbia lathyris TaxID=212925 RepID=UPI003313259A